MVGFLTGSNAIKLCDFMNKFGLMKFSFENFNCFHAYKRGYVMFEMNEYLEVRAFHKYDTNAISL